ncbi:MAG: SGNH/GDSL hydrolase family protein [Pseudomonadota bacterium]
MAKLLILGDSTVDNGLYVDDGEPDVPQQIAEHLPGWVIDQRAVDGHTCADVLENLPAVYDADAIFLSCGGNDALGHQSRLADPEPRPFAEVLVTLRAIREAFRAPYVKLLDALPDCKVLVATIYNPNYEDPQAFLQAPAEGGLSIFNDVILSEAVARKMAVVDLRRLMAAPGDYANAIEPNASGGGKIAKAVAEWAAASV